MIKVELSFGSQAELLAFFAGTKPLVLDAPTPTAIAEAPKAVKPPKPAPAPTPAASAPAPVEVAPSAPVAESPSEPVAEVTYQQVADLVVKYSRLHGRPATVAKLEPHGITALPAAKPEQFAAILATFEAALA